MNCCETFDHNADGGRPDTFQCTTCNEEFEAYCEHDAADIHDEDADHEFTSNAG